MIKRIRFGDPPSEAGRPVRVAVNTVLPELSDPSPVADRLIIEWFTDSGQLEPGDILAEEVVLRGADWLTRRWQDGGPKLKHLALAQRAAGLTPAEFSDRWRNHAGSAGGKVIPDGARGRAYVQNHPIVAGPYDALTEVYFDEPAGLRNRIDWFRDNPVADPLFGRSWFLAVREEIIE